MFGFVREKVSKNKIRYRDEQEKFDLDLTYITPRIIAMGFPSSDMEGLYRNPIGEVYRFFESRHKDNYKLYNLCAERDYDHNKFHGRVSRYPFEDHNAPPIDLIVSCCRDIHNWLAEDEKHVVGINCKAGKGRTGLIICCYLMHSKVVLDSEEAMLYYGTRRTKDGKGVTIASQQRYVRYYDQVLRMGGDPPEPRLLKLMRVKVNTIPDFPGDPYIIIISKNQEVHKSKPTPIPKKATSYELTIDYPVHGDVKIQMCSKKGRSHQNTCHFWFSTAFVPEETNSIELKKSEIDVANKDKKNVHFKPDFTIEAYFDAIEVPKSPKPEKKAKKPKKTKKESPTSSSPAPEEVEEVEVEIASPSTSKPKKAVVVAAQPEEEKKPEEFAQRRKRAQSFYDSTDEIDSDLSSSEIDEKQMEEYFAVSADEDDEAAANDAEATPDTPTVKSPKEKKSKKTEAEAAPAPEPKAVETQQEDAASESSEEAAQSPAADAPAETPAEVAAEAPVSPSEKDRKKEEKKAKKEEKAKEKADSEKVKKEKKDSKKELKVSTPRKEKK